MPYIEGVSNEHLMAKIALRVKEMEGNGLGEILLETPGISGFQRVLSVDLDVGPKAWRVGVCGRLRPK